MSLVEAIDKLYRFYQGKDMPNTQFLEKFNNLVDVIEHYGGTIGVHKKITEDILAKHTGGTYDSVNWKLAYTVVIHVIHTTFIVGILRISRRRTRKKDSIGNLIFRIKL